jgi:hypothetical protein
MARDRRGWPLALAARPLTGPGEHSRPTRSSAGPALPPDQPALRRSHSRTRTATTPRPTGPLTQRGFDLLVRKSRCGGLLVARHGTDSSFAFAWVPGDPVDACNVAPMRGPDHRCGPVVGSVGSMQCPFIRGAGGRSPNQGPGGPCRLPDAQYRRLSLGQVQVLLRCSRSGTPRLNPSSHAVQPVAPQIGPYPVVTHWLLSRANHPDSDRGYQRPDQPGPSRLVEV